MEQKRSLHEAYLLLACGLGVGGFVVGRKTVQRQNEEALKQIAADPKTAEAVKAVNALNELRCAFGGAAAEDKAKADAEARARALATGSVQTDKVRITIDAVYRGRIPRREEVQQPADSEPHQKEYLIVKYRVTNITKTATVDASADDCADNFGNKLERATDIDSTAASKLMAIPPDQEEGQILPGETRLKAIAFGRPLPNAEWYAIGFKMTDGFLLKGEPFFAKASAAEAEAFRQKIEQAEAEQKASELKEKAHSAELMAQAKAKEEIEANAKQEAERKRLEAIKDTLQTQEVRVRVIKVYRGPLNRDSLREEHEPLGYDCLVIAYSVENLSSQSLLDAMLMNVVDNYGNKLEDEKLAYRDAASHVGIDAYDGEKVIPGGKKIRLDVFKQPLENARWFIAECYMTKSDGSAKIVGVVKAANDPSAR
jgi:hypothetical protein